MHQVFLYLKSLDLVTKNEYFEARELLEQTLKKFIEMKPLFNYDLALFL